MWTQVGSTITIASQIFIGLAVASSTTGQLACFTLDGVAMSTSTRSSLAGSLWVPTSPLSTISATLSIDAGTTSNASALLDLPALSS